jgi:HAD superfamily hydrolase (TIGR01509 family)
MEETNYNQHIENKGEIKNLIIDLGGVCYQIEIYRTYHDLMKISTQPFKGIELEFETILDYEPFKLYETGKISTDEFIHSIRKIFYLNADDSRIISAWNKLLIGIFPFAINSVLALRSKYRLYLLSNINELHYNKVYRECKELYNYFNKCYFSHFIGRSKPDLNAFEYVLEDSNLKPEETLFVDDTLRNLKAAETLGLGTFHINGVYSLQSLPNFLI